MVALIVLFVAVVRRPQCCTSMKAYVRAAPVRAEVLPYTCSPSEKGHTKRVLFTYDIRQSRVRHVRIFLVSVTALFNRHPGPTL